MKLRFIARLVCFTFLITILFATVSCESETKKTTLKVVDIPKITIDNKDDDSSNDVLDLKNPILKNIPLNPEIVVEFLGEIDHNDLNMSGFLLQLQGTGLQIKKEELNYVFKEGTDILTISLANSELKLKEATSYKVTFKSNIFGDGYTLSNPLSFVFLTVSKSNSKDIIKFELSEKDNSKHIRGSVVGKINSTLRKVNLSYYPASPPRPIDSNQDGRPVQLSFIPDIVHTGVKISPSSRSPQVFATLERVTPDNSEYIPGKSIHIYKYNSVKYTVTASDGTTKEFEVTASPLDKEPPLSVPRNIKAEKVTNSTIDITWDPPTSTGVYKATKLKAKIAIYRVNYKKSGTNRQFPQKDTAEPKMNFKGLDFDSSYIITIVAENEAGDVSEAVTFVVKTTL